MSKPARVICRIGTALLALSALPNLYFNSLIYARADPGIGNADWHDWISLSWFGPGGLWSGTIRFDGESGGKLGEYVPLLLPALIAGGLLILAALALVAVAVIAAVSNKQLPQLILCGVSAVLIIGAYISFGRFAGAVTAPDFDLMGLFGEGFLTSLLGTFLHPQVLILRLDSAVSMLLVICGAVAVWIAAFKFTAAKGEQAK